MGKGSSGRRARLRVIRGGLCRPAGQQEGVDAEQRVGVDQPVGRHIDGAHDGGLGGPLATPDQPHSLLIDGLARDRRAGAGEGEIAVSLITHPGMEWRGHEKAKSYNTSVSVNLFPTTCSNTARLRRPTNRGMDAADRFRKLVKEKFRSNAKFAAACAHAGYEISEELIRRIGRRERKIRSDELPLFARLLKVEEKELRDDRHALAEKTADYAEPEDFEAELPAMQANHYDALMYFDEIYGLLLSAEEDVGVTVDPRRLARFARSITIEAPYDGETRATQSAVVLEQVARFKSWLVEDPFGRTRGASQAGG